MRGSKGHTALHAVRDAWTEEEMEKARFYFIRGAEYDVVRGDNAREVSEQEFFRHPFTQGGLSGAD